MGVDGEDLAGGDPGPCRTVARGACSLFIRFEVIPHES